MTKKKAQEEPILDETPLDSIEDFMSDMKDPEVEKASEALESAKVEEEAVEEKGQPSGVPDMWIFKAHMDCTFVIKGTTFQGIYNTGGQLISHINVPPIRLKFTNCHCRIDHEFARKHRMKMEDILMLIEQEPNYGKGYWMIHSPDNKATQSALEQVDQSRKKEPNVIGVRNNPTSAPKYREGRTIAK